MYSLPGRSMAAGSLHIRGVRLSNLSNYPKYPNGVKSHHWTLIGTKSLEAALNCQYLYYNTRQYNAFVS